MHAGLPRCTPASILITVLTALETTAVWSLERRHYGSAASLVEQAHRNKQAVDEPWEDANGVKAEAGHESAHDGALGSRSSVPGNVLLLQDDGVQRYKKNRKAGGHSSFLGVTVLILFVTLLGAMAMLLVGMQRRVKGSKESHEDDLMLYDRSGTPNYGAAKKNYSPRSSIGSAKHPVPKPPPVPMAPASSLISGKYQARSPYDEDDDEVVHFSAENKRVR